MPRKPEDLFSWYEGMMKEHADKGILEFQPLLDDLKKLTEKSAYIESISVHGSRVIGLHTEYSDLDLTILLYASEALPIVREELNRFLVFVPGMMNFFSDKPYDFWTYKGAEVGIHIFTVDDVRMRISNIFKSPDSFEEHSAWAQHIVIENKAIIAKESVLSEAREHLRHFPPELRTQLLARYLSRIEKRIKWWEKRLYWKNPFDEMFDMTLIFNDIIRCHYALNSGFPMAGFKQYFMEQSQLQPTIETDLQILLEFDPHPQGRLKTEKYNALVRIFNLFLASI